MARLYCRYRSSDPLDLGEALWLAHWGLPGQPWAQLVTQVRLPGLLSFRPVPVDCCDQQVAPIVLSCEFVGCQQHQGLPQPLVLLCRQIPPQHHLTSALVQTCCARWPPGRRRALLLCSARWRRWRSCGARATSASRRAGAWPSGSLGARWGCRCAWIWMQPVAYHHPDTAKKPVGRRAACNDPSQRAGALLWRVAQASCLPRRARGCLAAGERAGGRGVAAALGPAAPVLGAAPVHAGRR